MNYLNNIHSASLYETCLVLYKLKINLGFIMRAYFNKIANRFRRSLSFFNLTGGKENEKSNLIDNKKARTLDGKGFSVVNKEILTASSIVQNTTQNQVYDAGDVVKGYACAHTELLDFAAMLTAIDSEHEKNMEYLQRVHNIPEAIFRDLKRLIGITGTMLDRSLEFIEDQESHYKNQS